MRVTACRPDHVILCESVVDNRRQSSGVAKWRNATDGLARVFTDEIRIRSMN
jgi:hypothetical protein